MRSGESCAVAGMRPERERTLLMEFKGIGPVAALVRVSLAKDRDEILRAAA